ncbi:MAG TPA: PAS domain S-box protein, partial [Longimicrobiales bacterium]|nr:PAS domain S-box protein [Longimicrobiales bacterium]
VLLALGSVVLRGNLLWSTGSALHTVVEALATVLAFIVGGLALVRYYSRKQITFLLIGCGFLGAGLLDLNHTLTTSDWIISALLEVDGTLRPADLFAWTWTAERVFLSLFLFGSLLAWRQEGEEDSGEGAREAWIYGTALVMTLANLLFFQWLPLGTLSLPFRTITRPTEFIPALFFALTFLGFLRKGVWRRDAFEHWLLASLLIAVMAHAGFMAFSEQRYDARFDAAHLLKLVSYAAILTGLLSDVYETFMREAKGLEALRLSNDALAREVEVRADAEQAVEEGRARLQSFLDNANDLIQSVTPEGRILYVNSSWKRVLGYGDDDLRRLSLFEIAHPSHREALKREVERLLGGGRPRRFDVDYVASDGRVVMLSGSMQALQSAGRTVATQSILRDVTEQRLAERKLDESQRNLEALVENTGDAIWSVDREHRLITKNSSFALVIEARTGVEPSVGQLPKELFPAEDVGWYEELYDRTLRGERHVALRSERVDGQLRYFELYANPIQSLGGVSGAVFFGKDVTERARAQELLAAAKDEAEAANKAKSDFLASMSHELRTPLNSVIGFTNILLKNKENRFSDKDLGFLERVLSNGKHLLALINEVLDLAKVEAGRMELIIDQVDLKQLCVETVQQLEGQAKAKEGQVRLVADVPPEVSPVETDAAKLKQVIINLVGNALKFTHRGSVTVRLELGSDGRTPVAIAVEDTGIGIPEDRLGLIFEAFQQAEAGTARKYGGTGLGLALSRSICLLMGYDLIVESRLGEGSTFKIVLGERPERAVRGREPEEPEEPGVHAAAAYDASEYDASEYVASPARAAVAERRVSMRNFKVLVVDDERDSRVLIAHYLEEFGCRVVTATGGEQGLRLAREHAPDLMTLDLIMPGMSGWEVLEQMKMDPELRSIPVVVVSIVANEGEGSLIGAVDLVPKPFEREDLLGVLWRHLGRRRGGRVLVMADSGGMRRELSSFLSRRGLEVIFAEEGEGLREAVDTEAPDAILVDFEEGGRQRLVSLERLRSSRLHAGVPTFVLADELDAETRERLGELFAVVVPRGDPAMALEGLLEEIFPTADFAAP